MCNKKKKHAENYTLAGMNHVCASQTPPQQTISGNMTICMQECVPASSSECVCEYMLHEICNKTAYDSGGFGSAHEVFQ